LVLCVSKMEMAEQVVSHFQITLSNKQ